jgi:hypothetical protein
LPFEPDSNLVCLALNPRGNRSVACANAFVRHLHDALRADPSHPLQVKEYFGSVTSLKLETLGAAETRRIFAGLGLDPPARPTDGGDLVMLRHTLMNPYLTDRADGLDYIEGYFDFLGRCAALTGAA